MKIWNFLYSHFFVYLLLFFTTIIITNSNAYADSNVTIGSGTTMSINLYGSLYQNKEFVSCGDGHAIDVYSDGSYLAFEFGTLSGSTFNYSNVYDFTSVGTLANNVYFSSSNSSTLVHKVTCQPFLDTTLGSGYLIGVNRNATFATSSSFQDLFFIYYNSSLSKYLVYQISPDFTNINYVRGSFVVNSSGELYYSYVNSSQSSTTFYVRYYGTTVQGYSSYNLDTGYTIYASYMSLLDGSNPYLVLRQYHDSSYYFNVYLLSGSSALQLYNNSVGDNLLATNATNDRLVSYRYTSGGSASTPQQYSLTSSGLTFQTAGVGTSPENISNNYNIYNRVSENLLTTRTTNFVRFHYFDTTSLLDIQKINIVSNGVSGDGQYIYITTNSNVYQYSFSTTGFCEGTNEYYYTPSYTNYTTEETLSKSFNYKGELSYMSGSYVTEYSSGTHEIIINPLTGLTETSIFYQNFDYIDYFDVGDIPLTGDYKKYYIFNSGAYIRLNKSIGGGFVLGVEQNEVIYNNYTQNGINSLYFHTIDSSGNDKELSFDLYMQQNGSTGRVPITGDFYTNQEYKFKNKFRTFKVVFQNYNLFDLIDGVGAVNIYLENVYGNYYTYTNSYDSVKNWCSYLDPVTGERKLKNDVDGTILDQNALENGQIDINGNSITNSNSSITGDFISKYPVFGVILDKLPYLEQIKNVFLPFPSNPSSLSINVSVPSLVTNGTTLKIGSYDSFVSVSNLSDSYYLDTTDVSVDSSASKKLISIFLSFLYILSFLIVLFFKLFPFTLMFFFGKYLGEMVTGYMGLTNLKQSSGSSIKFGAFLVFLIPVVTVTITITAFLSNLGYFDFFNGLMSYLNYIFATFSVNFLDYSVFASVTNFLLPSFLTFSLLYIVFAMVYRNLTIINN